MAELQWIWVDTDGEQITVSQDELRSALAAGSLPAFTLVWRAGWQKWAHAMNIRELAEALPLGKRGIPVQVPSLAGQSQPPPPPLERYQRHLKNVEAAPLFRSREGGGVLSEPPPRKSVSQVPIPVTRPVQPTLADDRMTPTHRHTLRPVGAVPPAPRVPNLKLEGSSQADRAADASTDSPASAFPEPADAAEEIAPQSVIPVGDEPEQTSPARRLSSLQSPLPPDSQTREASTRAGTNPLLLVVAALLGATLALLIVVVIRGVLGDSNAGERVSSAASAAAAPSSSEGAAARAPISACRLVHPPRRIYPDVDLRVPPLVESHGSPKQLAVGFALRSGVAVGLTLDLSSFSQKVVFSKRLQVPIVGVVPLTHPKLAFSVNRQNARAAFERTVDAKPAFRIGRAADGFVRLTGDGRRQLVWPSDVPADKAKLTAPRVAALAEGYAYVFREGGQKGQVRWGWLGLDGLKRSDLNSVPLGAALLGTPNLASNQELALLTVVVRDSPDQDWSLALAAAKFGEKPTEARRLPTEASAISPSSAALRDGHWLVQWSEKQGEAHRVKARVLGPSLEPVSETFEVTGAELDAGQGTLWANDDAGLSLFLVKSDSGFDLWGASFECS